MEAKEKPKYRFANGIKSALGNPKGIKVLPKEQAKTK